MTDTPMEVNEAITSHQEQQSEGAPTPSQATSVSKTKSKKGTGGEENLKLLKSAPFVKKAISDVDDEAALEKIKAKIVSIFDARIDAIQLAKIEEQEKREAVQKALAELGDKGISLSEIKEMLT